MSTQDISVNVHPILRDNKLVNLTVTINKVCIQNERQYKKYPYFTEVELRTKQKNFV